MPDSERMREAVEAAAKAEMAAHSVGEDTWEGAGEITRNRFREVAKRGIEAALPFLGGLPPKPKEPTELERRLRRSLERYGQHEPYCTFSAHSVTKPCICGFHEALQAVDACPSGCPPPEDEK